MITFQLTALHHKLTHKVVVEIFNLKAMSWLLSKGWWWKLDENIVGSGKTGTVSHFLDSSPFSVALGLKGRSPFCQMTINTVAFTAASQTFPLSIRGTQSTHLLAFLHFIKVFVRATRLCHLSKLKNDAVLVRFGLEVVCRVVHGSIGLISLVSIFDTIDVPIRLLRQLFLVLKQIGSYLIVCLITLLKIFSWQKPRSLSDWIFEFSIPKRTSGSLTNPLLLQCFTWGHPRRGMLHDYSRPWLYTFAASSITFWPLGPWRKLALQEFSVTDSFVIRAAISGV